MSPDYVEVIRERYERLIADPYWPDSQEKARRAVRALLNALKVADEPVGGDPE